MDTALAHTVRRDACPLRRSFVERETSEAPTPLAQLLRTREDVGGKGGALRITLLMTLIWVNARQPYSTSRVAAYWAELLGRDDPHGEGARAVRDCLHELDDRGVIQLHSKGPRTEIILRNESAPFTTDGGPTPYTAPYGVEPYIPVPRAFWTEGLVAKLSGAGVAMYLCALALTRTDEHEFFIATQFFENSFGISRSSRKRGLAELAEHGVITTRVQEQSMDLVTRRRVRRNVYRLTKTYRLPPAYKAAQETAKDSVDEIIQNLITKHDPKP
ncbi:hypothetical protein [Microbacterium enclense]|uniref:Uncharacterized protein n=1 Tax=Microbacterium enclense TaxID=993073 RepID=A0A1G6RF70_9MICO|nr:hypothetical protein [Microbacterium enclense]SDD03300.1 hypothetical protein SAMN05216418_0116 [Microbacterium enclense]